MLKAIRRASRISLITDTDPRNSAAASLLMLLSYHRRDANPDDVAAMLVPSTATALDELANAASQFGLSGEWKTTGLRDLRRPAIVPWQGSGFAVVVPPRRGRVVVHDPHGGTERMTISTATDRYGGVALELLAARPRDEGVTLARLIGQPSAFGWIATKVILLSLLMQAFLLASPYYMQLTFDRAVPSGNRQILAVLAAAFAALTLLRITTEWLRAKVLTALGEALHQQIVRRLFTHLIRLPMGWFEDRQSGEIAAGFASSTEISNLFTQDLTAAIVDGVLAIFTLAMLLIYSPLLTLVVFGCHAGLLLIRRRSIPVLTTTEDDYWRACAGERSHFMETVRSILSIKVMGREDRREDLWREKLDAVIRKSGAFERAKTQMRMAEGAVGSLENVATVYVGAQLVIEGMLTLGMLFAFFAYKTIFSSAMFRLHHAATRYRTLDVHLQRVGDIGREPTERLGPPTLAGADNLSGHIALNGLGFCYPGCDIPVLADINATIKSGEFIAITGPSGSGKSTLVKIIIGVINPTAGNILFDGRSPSALGLANLRSQLGVVLQDDVIVTGTIAQNISFFDAKPDLEWLRQCAVIAGLDEEIMARPLGYESEIYDLANGLSGGQRQRLLLARALYRRPSILILDESTSQLDFAKESEICARIARLDMTRIMITHRTATMAVADRLYTLTDGRLFESGVPQDRATSAAAG